MPELLEVELYRQLAEGALGRPVGVVEVPDPHCLAPGITAELLGAVLVGRSLVAARRRGKLLLLDSPEHTLGLHFGMTGSLGLDDRRAIDRLLYAPAVKADRWVRFRLRFSDGGSLELHDPRRFARVWLGPDEEGLGPDALSLSAAQLTRVLEARGDGPPLKARLMDQSRLAGLGNLLVDEILWRAGLSPRRPTGSLDAAERQRLARVVRATLRQLSARGGSHTGDLMSQRQVGGRCRRDGTELRQTKVGGRTTWWCPLHQV